MRVAVIHNLPPGGARRRLAQQLAHLDADLIEICLATATPVTADPLVVAHRLRAPGVPRAMRPPLRYLDFVTVARAWRAVAAAVRRVKPSVLFANPCQQLRAPGALIGATAPSLYFCDEPRALDGDPEVRGSRNARTRLLYEQLYAAERRHDRRATLAAARIATNSSYTAAQIGTVYGRVAEVLPMGVPERFTPTFQDPRHLLSVGSLTPDKGHDLVLRAAAAARSRWPVVIVAPRPDTYAERALKVLAEQLRVSLTIHTAVTDDELIDCYRGALATLYLARSEPFGLVSIEAQACGSPVIVANEGGLPETVEHGVTGFIVTRDPTAVAAGVDQLAADARRESIAHAAARRAGQRSWKHATAPLQAMLEALDTAPCG